MDMRDEWLAGLRSWAVGKDSLRELWLFGSRATGRSRADSDVDLERFPADLNREGFTKRFG
jgi:predicted nucleotidyltransferase